jgi:PAS domain S-box-containing protein
MTREELCRNIVEGTQDAIIFADREGIIQLWNSKAETMFGYHAEVVVGQTLDLIIPERPRGMMVNSPMLIVNSGKRIPRCFCQRIIRRHHRLLHQRFQ